MALKLSMHVTIHSTADDPTLRDEFGKPVRAAFIYCAVRILLLPKKAEIPQMARALSVERACLNDKEEIILCGKVYNHNDVKNGTRYALPDIRQLELGSGEIVKIINATIRNRTFFIQGSVPGCVS